MRSRAIVLIQQILKFVGYATIKKTEPESLADQPIAVTNSSKYNLPAGLGLRTADFSLPAGLGLRTAIFSLPAGLGLHTANFPLPAGLGLHSARTINLPAGLGLHSANSFNWPADLVCAQQVGIQTRGSSWLSSSQGLQKMLST
jgi:hypothetical protein